MRESFLGHCEVAQRLAERMGLDASLSVCLGQIYERWDGHGLPHGLAGDAIAPAVMLVALAQDAVIWDRIGGPDAAVTTIGKRSGGAYDPRMAERFCAQARTILADVQDEPTWDAVLNMEPGGHRPLTDDEFDRACEAIADFADIKSPYTLGHSARGRHTGGRRRRAVRLAERRRGDVATCRPAPRHWPCGDLRGDLDQGGHALGTRA